MKIEQNTAKEVLNSKRSKEKSEKKKLQESTERLIQSYILCKDAREKERILSIIKRNNPDFKPGKH